MATILHFGETEIDFLEVAELWPPAYGSFYEHNGAQERVAAALRSGTLLLLRDEDTRILIAAAAIDLLTYSPHMFVPFVLVRAGVQNESSIRRQLNAQILRLALVRGVERLMFHITKNDDYNRTVAEISQELKKSGSKINIEIAGDIDNLYGDGRTISTVSLFIQPEERPDLTKNIVRESNEFYKTVLRMGKKEALAAILGTSPSATGSSTSTMALVGGGTGGFGGAQAACCSGCNEDNKTDKAGNSKDGKESGKDGKDSKDGADKGSGKDGVERLVKMTPEKGAIDTLGIFADYQKLGVQQFDRSSQDFPFLPLA
ncbi:MULTISPECIES: hypothetical protein [Rhizobium]|uniref:hypothetical protein n=1 Tax=Rhizobium TaxID=379 RepID=UPI0004627E80|nr:MULTISPECIES: hypothetical protein [Rhizobium]MCS0462931.1 hypothetical protein [Rhizobium favelukesii]UFS82018.1 hypothetical protein LPB79_27675 [Rhizobium sp. T136]